MTNHIRPALVTAVLLVMVLVPLSWMATSGSHRPGDDLAWAQVSSCGNAILEPGEDCDPPGSITCPPGSPAGAFQPCNPDCTCPVATTTTTTTSTTTTTLVGLDHFQCYELKPEAFPSRVVTVIDQFGTLSLPLRYPTNLCNPTSKNSEGIIDPTDHLVAYRTQPPSFTRRPNQTVVNQFGTLQLDVVRPDVLLVPSGKDGVAQIPPLDHFQCYKVKRSKGSPKFAKRTVSVANQFETTTLTVSRPLRLCAPANKNGEDPTAPTHPDHLLCYKVRGGRFTGSDRTISNQFGVDQVRVINRRELCLPSLKNPGATTTTTTTTSSTTTSSTTTSSTTTSSTTTSSTTTSTTTTSSTTTTTLYGSPSRAFLVPTGSLLD